VSNFDVFIDRVLSHEGGYCFDPRDPGGETQWGISKRAYPMLNIKTLTRQQAIEIYRTDYWNRVRGESLPNDIAFQVLDAAVNHGVTRSVMWMQAAVDVADDGKLGPVTISAVQKADPRDTILKFNAARLDFYTRLSTWGVYGAGWTRRIVANLKYAAKDN
jgi:lysozyme family protein